MHLLHDLPILVCNSRIIPHIYITIFHFAFETCIYLSDVPIRIRVALVFFHLRRFVSFRFHLIIYNLPSELLDFTADG